MEDMPALGLSFGGKEGILILARVVGIVSASWKLFFRVNEVMEQSSPVRSDNVWRLCLVGHRSGILPALCISMLQQFSLYAFRLRI